MKNVFTLLLLIMTCTLSAQVGLQVVNDGIIEKTLTVGQTVVGDSILNIAGGISLTGGIALGDTRGNVFLGKAAGIENQGGGSNTAVGAQSLQLNETGNNNTAMGVLSLGSNIDGENNTALGFNALNKNVGAIVDMGINRNGSGNTSVGALSMAANTGGGNNTAVGIEALASNTIASNNVAIGANSLRSTQQAGDNVAVGVEALFSNQFGTNNVAVGKSAMNANVGGENNTAVGSSSMNINNSGSNNTVVGATAFQGNSSGGQNTAIGVAAMQANNGLCNTAVGYLSFTTAANSTFANSTALGCNTEITASNMARIGDDNVTTLGGFTNWTKLVSANQQKRTKSNVPGLNFINQLNPVTYQMTKGKGTNVREAGFMVEELNAVVTDSDFAFDGIDKSVDGTDVYGIRYASFVVPLVQAVKELSAKNEQLEAEKETQQATITALEERMNKMESMIAQLATSGVEERSSATQVVTLSEVQLAQNNPNPFSEFTAIPYFLPEFVQEATLQITNANSQVIKIIPITNRGKGEVVLETKLLGNGAYFYTLWVDGVAQDTKQMVLQK